MVKYLSVCLCDTFMAKAVYAESTFSLWSTPPVSVKMEDSSLCDLRMVASIGIDMLGETYWKYVVKEKFAKGTAEDAQRMAESFVKNSVKEKFGSVIDAENIPDFEKNATDIVRRGIAKYAETRDEKRLRRQRIIRQINYENSWKNKVLPYGALQKLESSVIEPLNALRAKYTPMNLLGKYLDVGR